MTIILSVWKPAWFGPASIIVAIFVLLGLY